MNNLSWFLYAVDVIESIGLLLNHIVIWSFIMAIISIIVAVSMINVKKQYIIIENADEIMEINKMGKNILSFVKKSIKPFFIVLAVSTFFPSEKTMYLMLGSEIGEKVIQSETSKRVYDILNKKLDEYLSVE